MTAEQTFPSLSIQAGSPTSINVNLPGDEEVWYPVVPEELVGKELPSFVVEWIIEADEIGVIVQELLQAPTRSLCRIMPITDQGFGSWGKISPTRSFYFGTSLTSSFDVGGFEAQPTIEGQPTGVALPSSLEEIIAMAKRLDAWLDKGRRVQAWLDDEGYGHLNWVPQTAGTD